MSELIAKPVVKNKFWVVEESGQKVATIQAVEDGGIVYVHNDRREKYPSVKNLKQKYNIKFGLAEKIKKENVKTVYGYPVTGKAYNQVWDVQRRLPIYSKTLKSKSLFCAGFYLVKFNGNWAENFCPKNITLSRYDYIGPFCTKEEAQKKLKEIVCKN
jgi:hypothetical protein